MILFGFFKNGFPNAAANGNSVPDDQNNSFEEKNSQHFIRKLNLSKYYELNWLYQMDNLKITHWIYELERQNDQTAFLFNPMEH